MLDKYVVVLSFVFEFVRVRVVFMSRFAAGLHPYLLLLGVKGLLVA